VNGLRIDKPFGCDPNKIFLWLGRFLLAWFAAIGTLSFYYNLKNSTSYLNSWTIGEWLITYAGGFVRRGLPGQVLYGIAGVFHVSPVDVIRLWCCLAFLLFICVLWDLVGRHLDKVLLASPFCLLMPLLGDYFFRKDISVVLLYGLCLWVLANQSTARSRRNAFYGLAVVNAFGVLAVLSHESFIFFGLPSLVWAISCWKVSHFFGKLNCFALLRGFILLGPIVLASIAALIFKGSDQNVVLIHRSWQDLAPLFANQAGLSSSLPPDGAINALGWSLDQQPTFVISQLLSPIAYAFGQSPPLSPAFPAVLPWLFTVYWVLLLFSSAGEAGWRTRRIQIALIQLICIAPLFLIGVDFGRWIFLLTSSCSLLYGFWVKTLSEETAEIASSPVVMPLLAQSLFSRFFRWGIFSRLGLLLLGIPACCWSLRGFGLATPIGYPYKFFIICLLKGNCAG